MGWGGGKDTKLGAKLRESSRFRRRRKLHPEVPRRSIYACNILPMNVTYQKH